MISKIYENIMIMATQMDDGHVTIRVVDGSIAKNAKKIATKESLKNIFIDPGDDNRMNANFSRNTDFRTYIRRSDFISLNSSTNL